MFSISALAAASPSVPIFCVPDFCPHRFPARALIYIFCILDVFPHRCLARAFLISVPDVCPHCCCLVKHSYCLCSRFLTSLLPHRAFLLSMFPIFDLTAASQSIPIVYVPDFCPHCSLTDRSYFLCSRFLTPLLPRRAFLLSMFPIFDLTAASQSIPIVYVPDFCPHCSLTDRSYFLCSRFLT